MGKSEIAIDLFTFASWLAVSQNHQGDMLLLDTSVPFVSGVRERSPDEFPVVGSTKRLSCYSEKSGFPRAVSRVMWFKDGVRVRDSHKHQIYSIYE